MAKPSPTFIFRELRRRKVFRTAAYYLVGAWVTLQVCELVFDVLEFPAEALRFVLAAAIVGFPVALFFGWKYDITPKGIRRTPSITEEEQDNDLSLKRVDYLMLVALAAVAIIIAVQMPLPEITQQTFTAPPNNSIAVMPFESCDGQDIDFMMAAGIATEVINRLAERGKLKVLARASSFSFAGFGLPLPQIAEPLGVQHVVTGTVCRDGTSMTLSAELSDADGFVVWSDSFAQAVNPTGKITQTLASAAASGIAAELGDLIPAKPDALVDKLAYEQLLIGKEHNARGDEEQARAAFERALEKQPNYAEAQYMIALLELGTLASVEQEGTETAKFGRIAARAERLVRQQLEYDDGSAHTHLIAGRIIAATASVDEDQLWRHSADFDEEEMTAQRASINDRYAEAEQHFRTSISINPTVTESYTRLAGVVDAQDRINEALEILEQAQIRDPFNVGLNVHIARRWADRGRFRQAIELLQRFRVLPEIPSRTWFWQLELMHYHDFSAELCATLIEMLQHDPGAFESLTNRWQAFWFISDLARLGLFEEAEAWKVRIENIPITYWMREYGLVIYQMETGSNDEAVRRRVQKLAAMSDEEMLDAWTMLGRNWAIDLTNAGEIERAIKLMQSIQHSPDGAAGNPLILAALLQLVGRDDEAAPVLDRAVAQLEEVFDSGVRKPGTLEQLAEAYARQHRDEEAINMLQKAVEYHLRLLWKSNRNLCGTDRSLFTLDANMPPQFDKFNSSPAKRLKDDPRIIALCERVEMDLEQQAKRIRAMLAKHDFDELLAPLMAMAEDGS